MVGMGGTSKIMVAVRKRPLTQEEVDRDEADAILVSPLDSTVHVHEPRTKVDTSKYTEVHDFRFDLTFAETDNNLTLYKKCVSPLVREAFTQGANCSCFAYGQTGSGKTFTMLGCPGQEEEGIFALAAGDIFEMAGEMGLAVCVSFFEIYCGKLYDLLQNRKLVAALENSKKEVVVRDLHLEVVHNKTELVQKMTHGSELRRVSANSVNDESSRSHAILQLDLKKTHKTHGKLAFIDLAGSERGADSMQLSRQTQQDGAGINRSLLALKECIRAMDQDQNHIPFRDSELTKVLRDIFVGKSKSLMIANVSPARSSCEQTLNTLRYAARVKSFKGERVSRGVSRSTEGLVGRSNTRINKEIEARILRPADSRKARVLAPRPARVVRPVANPKHLLCGGEEEEDLSRGGFHTYSKIGANNKIGDNHSQKNKSINYKPERNNVIKKIKKEIKQNFNSYAPFDSSGGKSWVISPENTNNDDINSHINNNINKNNNNNNINNNIHNNNNINNNNSIINNNNDIVDNNHNIHSMRSNLSGELKANTAELGGPEIFSDIEYNSVCSDPQKDDIYTQRKMQVALRLKRRAAEVQRRNEKKNETKNEEKNETKSETKNQFKNESKNQKTNQKNALNRTQNVTKSSPHNPPTSDRGANENNSNNQNNNKNNGKNNTKGNMSKSSTFETLDPQSTQETLNECIYQQGFEFKSKKQYILHATLFNLVNNLPLLGPADLNVDKKIVQQKIIETYMSPGVQLNSDFVATPTINPFSQNILNNLRLNSYTLKNVDLETLTALQNHVNERLNLKMKQVVDIVWKNVEHESDDTKSHLRQDAIMVVVHRESPGQEFLDYVRTGVGQNLARALLLKQITSECENLKALSLDISSVYDQLHKGEEESPDNMLVR